MCIKLATKGMGKSRMGRYNRRQTAGGIFKKTGDFYGGFPLFALQNLAKLCRIVAVLRQFGEARFGPFQNGQKGRMAA